MNEEMYDVLETCLQELNNGVDLETVLSRHPKFAADLRPILKVSAQAKKTAAPVPSQDAVVRGRARLMQKVAELREEKTAPRKRVIPFFQRLAISFAVTATLLLSGTGLVGASSTALPGHKLYPVKRGWEDVRLFFTFDDQERRSLEEIFEKERVHEVDELLSEQDHTLVDFSGVFTYRNGAMYVDEVQVVFPAGAQIPTEGATLHIIGQTDDGYVEVIRFEILQSGSVVPDKNPVPSPVNNNEPKPTEPVIKSEETPTEANNTDGTIEPVETEVNGGDGEKEKENKDEGGDKGDDNGGDKGEDNGGD
jgi:hypothetical protein